MNGSAPFTFAAAPKPPDIDPSHGTTTNKRSRSALPSEPDGMRRSYADKLRQWQAPIAQTQTTMSKSDIPLPRSDCVFSDKDKGVAARIEAQAHERLCLPWKDTLIIKTVTGTHSFGYVQTKLTQKWAPKSAWQLIDLPNNYFAARFSSAEDRNFALTGGPWMIGGSYLVIQQWEPYFRATEETIKSMAVWVRISGLPLEFMNVDFLEQLGDYLGTSLKVDMTTVHQTRGKFARICVQIDLNKPLKTFLELERAWCKLEYEGLNTICFNCGKFGHTLEGCKPMGEQQDENVGANLNVAASNSKEQNQFSSPLKDYGPWMQVTYNKSRKPQNYQRRFAEPTKTFMTNKGKEKVNEHIGSKFQALQEESETSGHDIAPSYEPVIKKHSGTTFTISSSAARKNTDRRKVLKDISHNKAPKKPELTPALTMYQIKETSEKPRQSANNENHKNNGEEFVNLVTSKQSLKPLANQPPSPPHINLIKSTDSVCTQGITGSLAISPILQEEPPDPISLRPHDENLAKMQQDDENGNSICVSNDNRDLVHMDTQSTFQ